MACHLAGEVHRGFYMRDHSAFRILCCFLECAWRDGTNAYPSIERLMHVTGLSQSGAYAALRRLEGLGYVEHVGCVTYQPRWRKKPWKVQPGVFPKRYNRHCRKLWRVCVETLEGDMALQAIAHCVDKARRSERPILLRPFWPEDMLPMVEEGQFDAIIQRYGRMVDFLRETPKETPEKARVHSDPAYRTPKKCRQKRVEKERPILAREDDAVQDLIRSFDAEPQIQQALLSAHRQGERLIVATATMVRHLSDDRVQAGLSRQGIREIVSVGFPANDRADENTDPGAHGAQRLVLKAAG